LSKDPHKDVISQARKQLAEIFEESEQCVYIYLDDLNKVCNKRFARLLGYKSPAEWAGVRGNFPEVFVSPRDRGTLVTTYQKAMNGLIGSTVPIAWRRKDGREVPSTTILVPIVYDGHRIALHFITPK